MTVACNMGVKNIGENVFDFHRPCFIIASAGCPDSHRAMAPDARMLAVSGHQFERDHRHRP